VNAAAYASVSAQLMDKEHGTPLRLDDDKKGGKNKKTKTAAGKTTGKKSAGKKGKNRKRA
jgi:hypothetical protein